MNKTKTCTICQIEKPIEDFIKDNRSPTGYKNQCKECKNKIAKDRYIIIKDNLDFRIRLRKNTMKFKNSHREKIRDEALIYNANPVVKDRKKKWYENNQINTINGIISRMYKRAQKRSIEENFDFNIEVSDIKYEKYCPLLNLELNWNGGPRTDITPSLDKIDPKKGYVKGNIRVLSFLANRMKLNANYKNLENFSKNIMNYLHNKDIVQSIENENL